MDRVLLWRVDLGQGGKHEMSRRGGRDLVLGQLCPQAVETHERREHRGRLGFHWAGSLVGCTPWAEGQERCSPAKIGERS